MRRYRRNVLILATGIALIPMALIMLAAFLASIFGCRINEAAPQVCTLLGANIGGALHGLLNLGWLSLLLIPMLMVLVPLWLLFEWSAHTVRRRRARRQRGAMREVEA